uniref:Uncharacterized protein n=1 Tax=Aegilops tauschii subsp. strangulata TaxID=200361 RepID=A0A453BAP5_AEGTS
MKLQNSLCECTYAHLDTHVVSCVNLPFCLSDLAKKSAITSSPLSCFDKSQELVVDERPWLPRDELHPLRTPLARPHRSRRARAGREESPDSDAASSSPDDSVSAPVVGSVGEDTGSGPARRTGWSRSWRGPSKSARTAAASSAAAGLGGRCVG